MRSCERERLRTEARRGRGHKKERPDKSLVRLAVSLILTVVIVFSCRLPFEPCKKFKNEVQFFLSYSYDFKGMAKDAYEYISGLINRPEAVPADAVLKESEE